MAGASVQFFGKENVLKAYRARGIETWGLFDKKQFINAGESEADLTAFLEMLEPGGSQSIYTLKVYRDIDDPDELTDRTECNGSFNFKLFAAMAPASLVPATVSGIGGQHSTDPILSKLQGVINDEVASAIDRKLNGEKETDEEGWNGVIMGYVRDPEKLQQAAPIIMAVIDKIGSYFRPGIATIPAAALAGTQPVQRVGAVPAAQPAADASEENMHRLAAALDRWEKADPDVIEVIEKIVLLAETNKSKYNMAKSLL